MDSHMRKTFSLLPILLIIIVFIGLFALFSGRFLDTGEVSKTYATYSDIPNDDGIHTWLPDFFPTQAKDIGASTIVEHDYLQVTFRLEKNAASEFDKTFTVQMSDAGIKFLQNEWITQGWCKLAKVPEEGDDEHFYLIGKATGKAGYIYVLTLISPSRYGDSDKETRENMARYCVLKNR
jgi:hypothetical protein